MMWMHVPVCVCRLAASLFSCLRSQPMRPSSSPPWLACTVSPSLTPQQHPKQSRMTLTSPAPAAESTSLEVWVLRLSPVMLCAYTKHAAYTFAYVYAVSAMQNAGMTWTQICTRSRSVQACSIVQPSKSLSGLGRLTSEVSNLRGDLKGDCS